MEWSPRSSLPDSEGIFSCAWTRWRGRCSFLHGSLCSTPSCWLLVLYVAAPATTLSRSKTVGFLCGVNHRTTKRVSGRVELGAAWVSSLSSCLSLSSMSAAYPGKGYAPYIQQAGGSFFSSLDQFNFFFGLCADLSKGKKTSDVDIEVLRGHFRHAPSGEGTGQYCGQTASKE